LAEKLCKYLCVTFFCTSIFSYDVSYIDGSNVPITIRPVSGSYTKTSGTYDCGVAGQCLKDLRTAADPSIRFIKDGKVIGTWAACSPLTNNNPQYCCSDNHKTPETCPKSAIPAKFYSNLKKICKSEKWNLYKTNLGPQSYFFAYDDRTSTYTCKPSGTRTAPDFIVTFCEVTGTAGK
jgi:hypothetical protein